eukprot:g23122.t1
MYHFDGTPDSHSKLWQELDFNSPVREFEYGGGEIKYPEAKVESGKGVQHQWCPLLLMMLLVLDNCQVLVGHLLSEEQHFVPEVWKSCLESIHSELAR